MNAISDHAEPAAIRALAERLIAIRSVSPDPAGETRCAEALIEALPRGIEHGAWRTSDGRPVIWALARGRTKRTVVLLGHYDTVGFGEYASLGAPQGAGIALDSARLREILLDPRIDPAAIGSARSDLEEERRTPGTWLFGRGAFDMKSGLAVGIAALGAMAADPGLEGNVLFIATPDEENQSAGMSVAVRELARMRDERGLDLLGVLNLDSVEAPVAYSGVMGKQLAGLWVLGRPAHAGDPFAGVDAAQIAAEIVSRATRTDLLADSTGDRRGPPAVALRLRDLKDRYDVQTTLEAEVELNLLTFDRTLDQTFARLREIASSAIAQVIGDMGALGRRLKPDAAREPGNIDPGACVLVWPELVERAGADRDAPGGPRPPRTADSRAITRDLIRDLAGRARLQGPTVVLTLLPPYYPSAAPGDGPLARAAKATLAREGIELRTWYPLITDACYVRAPQNHGAAARFMPAFATWDAPLDAAAALDLDVVTLGPWGHDAHGLLERVHAPYAFERLPRLIVEVVRGALRGG